MIGNHFPADFEKSQQVRIIMTLVSKRRGSSLASEVKDCPLEIIRSTGLETQIAVERKSIADSGCVLGG
jgi:hypothetical protein